MRKQIATLHAIILLTAVLFFLSFASGSELAEQKTGKKRGAINMTMGIAKSNDNESGNFGLLKSVGWNLLSGWASGSINFGIVKNEILAMGNISLNIPLKRIEPFATAGYGIIIERFCLVNNYGAGIRVPLGKSIGIVAEYRKIQYKFKNKQKKTKSLIKVDYFGAGIFYSF